MQWSELRAVLFIQRVRDDGLGTFTQVVKIGLEWPLDGSAICDISDRQYMAKDCDKFGRDLEMRGFVQRGCFVGDDKAWATAWLNDDDKGKPERLSDVFGQRIVPATLMWHFTTGNITGHLGTSRSANGIRHSRARNPYSVDNLAVRELPTMEQRLKHAGM